MFSSFRIGTIGALLAATLAMAGCNDVPISTMWALRKFDPLTADPAVVRAAVRLPYGLQPRRGGVKLVALWGKQEDPTSEKRVEVVLRESSVSAEGPMLAKELRPRADLYVYNLSQADVLRLRALQAEISRAKAEKQANFAKLDVQPEGCRTSELPDGPIRMTIFIKASEETGWLTLLNDVDLRSRVKDNKTLEETTPICGKSQARVVQAG